MRMDKKIETLADQEKLLNSVFEGSGLSYEYLSWLYRDSPDGIDISSDYRESGELLGHYTIVPQEWSFQGRTKRLALSLNTAVDEKARGKGLFTRLAEESYASAEKQNIQAVIGVANANSTPGFLRRLGFKLIGPLPVFGGIVLPRGGSGLASHAISPDFLADAKFDAIAESIHKGQSSSGVSQRWTPKKLIWRLSSPRGKYALHTCASGTLITTTAPLPLGIPAVVALKFFPYSVAGEVDVKSLIRKAAGFHRTPLFIYSGFNEQAKVTGMPLPRRLLPSPLNLIYKRLDDSMPHPDEVKFGTFEFLDFDAY